MNLSELKVMKAALHKLQLEVNRIRPGCQSCLAYEAGKCETFDAKPPDEYVRGDAECASWEYDNVPF